MTHAGGIGTLAQAQPQGTEQNGFARSGFAGNGGHAAGKFQVKRIDNGVIANG